MTTQPISQIAGAYRATLSVSGKSVPLILKESHGSDDFAKAKTAFDRGVECVLKPVCSTTVSGGGPCVAFECPGRDEITGFACDVLPVPSARKVASIAASIADGLDELHRAGIRHGAIRPQSVALLSRADRVVLFDVGRCLDGEILPYSAPEVAIAIRTPDFRADLFSLGSTAFVLLVGVLPFGESGDVAELARSIFTKPIPELPATVPHSLRHVLEKLMAKRPEERYQTAFGAAADLRKIADGDDQFGIAADDDPCSLRPPRHVYGHEENLSVLLDATRSARFGVCSFVTICGPSESTGALIEAFKSHRSLSHVLIAHARFAERRREPPLGALFSAFDSAIGAVLSDEGQGAAMKRRKLAEAIIPHAAILQNRVLSLPKLVPVFPAGSGERQQDADGHQQARKLSGAFSSLVRALSPPDRPLVIILDDAQRADPASLDVLGKMVASHTRDCYGTLILAYSSEEALDVNPLRNFLDGAASVSGMKTSRISLSSPPQRAVEQMVAEMLFEDPSAEEVQKLSRWVQACNYEVVQTLTKLRREGLLRFDAALFRWSWDQAAVSSYPLQPDSVIARLAALPQPSCRALGAGAVVGSSFSVLDVADLLGLPASGAAGLLRPCIIDGFALPCSVPGVHRIVNECIRQAAIALLSPQDLAKFHSARGHSLCRLYKERGQLPQDLFGALFHLNSVAHGISSAEELCELAELNICASKECRDSGAAASAREYSRVALAAAERAGPAGRSLIKDALREASCAESLALNHAEAETFLWRLVGIAECPEESAAAFQELSVASSRGAHPHASVHYTFKALEELGVRLPQLGDRAGILRELAAAESIVGQAVELAAAPEASTTRRTELLRQIYNSALCTAWSVKTEVLATLAISAVNELVPVTGKICPSLMASFALAVAQIKGSMRDASRLALLALSLAKQPQHRSVLPRVASLVAYHFLVWLQPVAKIEEVALEALQVAVSVGDFFGGPWTAACRCQMLFLTGKNLEELSDILPAMRSYCLELGNELAMMHAAAPRFAVEFLRSTLIGSTVDPLEDPLSCHFLDECRGKNAMTPATKFFVSKALVLLLFNRPASALCSLEAGTRSSLLTISDGFYHVFRGLAIAGVAASGDSGPPASFASEGGVRGALEAELGIVARMASECEATFDAVYCLLQAEVCKLDLHGSKNGACCCQVARLYESAVRSADRAGFRHVKALASLSAARFWSEFSPESENPHSAAARDALHSWGCSDQVVSAVIKAHGLQSVHVAAIPAVPASAVDAEMSLSLARFLFKRAFDKPALLKELLRVSMESCCATRGVFAIPDAGGGKLVVTAFKDRKVSEPRPVSIALSEFDPALLQVMGDVADARVPIEYSTEHSSVLAIPFVRQSGQLGGVLYLEHDSLPFFTPTRIDSIQAIAAQAAVVLENSQLWQDAREANARLEEIVAQQTTDLREKVSQLEAEVEQRNMAERALRDRSEQLRLIFENSASGMAIFEVTFEQGAAADFLVIRANTRAKTLTRRPGVPGVSPETVAQAWATIEGRLGSSLVGVLCSQKEFDRILQSATEAVQSKKTVRLETEFPTGLVIDGSLWVLDDSHVVALFNDVTEQRLVEQRLQRTARFDSLTTMAGGIAHQLSNLLQVASGNIALASKEAKESQEDFLGDASEAISSASRLSQQLRAYSGNTSTSVSNVDVSRLIRELESSLRRLFSGVDAKLQINLPPAPESLVVRVDETQLQQAIISIVANAVEACAGKLDGIVVLSLRKQELSAIEVTDLFFQNDVPACTAVVISCSDNGHGMNRDAVVHCCDPFWTTKQAGRGLGLAAVLGIVRRAGGALDVKSKLNEGTVTKLVFPIRSDVLVVTPPSPDVGSTPKPTERSISDLAAGRAVLVIDDEPTVRIVLKRLLQKLGVRALLASSGPEGITIFGEHSQEICLIVLDQLMPGMTGAEALPALRAVRDVPVIVASGFGDETTRFFKDRVELFLHKPFTIEDLSHALRQLLQ